MIGEFEFEVHRPSDKDIDIMRYVEDRRRAMDTSYRKEVVKTAEWSRGEYDSIPDARINNLDLFKIGLSRVAVNMRLVMLYDNPSEAVYRAQEDSDKYKVEILKQVDEYDKKISRFPAIYQELNRVANIEGTAIGMVSWHEEMEGNETVGDICTLTEIIPIKDFYWDAAGKFLNGNSAFTCNEIGYQKILSIDQFRKEYAGKDYKNIDAVLPNRGIPTECIYNGDWDSDWESGRWGVDGKYVHVFCLKIKRFYENGKFVDKEFIVANQQVIYEGEMRVPKVKGQKWFNCFKVEAIPTGGFAGLGIPALIRHPQEALDRMLTMAEAQAELAVNPVLFYNATSELLPDNIEYFPGAAYPYKGSGLGITNDMQFFQQPDITSGAQYIMNKMVEFITMITGIDLQALTDQTGSEKAIQTQNKREIQEKILKMSVLWNETHGWSDMAILRLAYLQEYYPEMRIQRVIGENGEQITKADYPSITVDGYMVKKAYSGGQSMDMLEKQPGAYSKLSIKPENLRFNVDVIVNSAQQDNGLDTVKVNRWNKVLDSLARIPNAAMYLDPEKMVKGTIKYSGVKQSELLSDRFEDFDDDVHPARKEFRAILLSETIPFEPIMPDNYEPEEYIYVFRDMMKLPAYKNSAAGIKKLIAEKFQEHMTNFADPYFKEKQKKIKEQETANEMQSNSMDGQVLKPEGGAMGTPEMNTPPSNGSQGGPSTLAQRTRSLAATLGDNTKKVAKGMGQKTPLI